MVSVAAWVVSSTMLVRVLFRSAIDVFITGVRRDPYGRCTEGVACWITLEMLLWHTMNGGPKWGGDRGKIGGAALIRGPMKKKRRSANDELQSSAGQSPIDGSARERALLAGVQLGRSRSPLMVRLRTGA